MYFNRVCPTPGLGDTVFGKTFPPHSSFHTPTHYSGIPHSSRPRRRPIRVSHAKDQTKCSILAPPTPFSYLHDNKAISQHAVKGGDLVMSVGPIFPYFRANPVFWPSAKTTKKQRA
jgi:hypothetical protein